MKKLFLSILFVIMLVLLWNVPAMAVDNLPALDRWSRQPVIVVPTVHDKAPVIDGHVDFKEWYYAETNAALKLGVQYYDYQLSASHELTDAEMEKLVNMVRNAPKPLLIHCKSGADRTGLVGALYLYSVEGKPAETADHELKLLYGHVPYLFWRNTIAMDHSFWRYVNDHAPATGAGSRKLASPLTKSEASAVSAN